MGNRNNVPKPQPGPPPSAQALDIVLGAWRAPALIAFVRSGLPDIMNSEEYNDPKTLAEKTECNAQAVYRLLRFLSTIDVCVENESGCFKLGPVGEVCTKSHPESVRDSILLEGSSAHISLWGNLPIFLKTGKKVTQEAFGVENYWDMCKADPEHMEIFQNAMTAYTRAFVSLIKNDVMVPTFNLSNIDVICDLGCAEGALALACSERFPASSYILADLPEVVSRIDGTKLTPKITIAECDFFKKETIPNADAYLLKYIIHDWDDAKCITILENIKAVNKEAKLFIFEFGPMPGANVPHLSKIFDIHMGIALNGHERTPDEYASMFDKGGYKRTHTHLIAGGNHPMHIQELSSKD